MTAELVRDVMTPGVVAVRPDGTVLFSQDGTGFVNVFQGLNGEVVHNAFPFCCGYAESLAVVRSEGRRGPV